MASTSPFLFNADTALTQLQAASFTVACWFKPSATVIDSSDLLTTALLLGPAWKVEMGVDGTVTFTINDSATSTTTSIASSDTIAADWNFVAVRYDLGVQVLTLYLNGTAYTVPFTDPADSSVSSYTADFQIGDAGRLDVGPSSTGAFGIDSVTVWARALLNVELDALFAGGSGSQYPFAGGAFNLVYQGLLINTPEKPVVGATDTGLWSITPAYDSGSETFSAQLDQLYEGVSLTSGYPWMADSFYDKILFAQHDNRTQYWTPPLPSLARDLPGLPTSDAVWDGVAVFAGHAMLWKEDRLKWSDVNDFTDYIPVATTAVSTVLPLSEPFTQPPPGGNVSVTVGTTASTVLSLSLSGSLAFPDTAVGQTATALLTIINTGNTVVSVTGLALPPGFSGTFSGDIGVNQSQPVEIIFAPSASANPINGGADSYGGLATVAAPGATGTLSLPISGTGTGLTKAIVLGGTLDFGMCKDGHSLTSALVIENTGTDTVTVYSVGFTGDQAADFALSGVFSPFPTTIAAGAKLFLPVTYSPTAAHTSSAIVTVTTDATAGPASLTLSGQGVTSFVRAVVFVTDNGSCQFGQVPSGTTATGTLSVYNVSGYDFKVMGLTLPDGFTATAPGTNIAAFGSQDIVVTFSPISAIDYGGQISATFNKRVDGTGTAQATGTGTISGKSIVISGVLDFGDVPVGGTDQALLTITNRGTVALTVSGITYPTGFTGAYTGTIDPGASAYVLVTFAPTVAAPYSGTLTVASDAVEGSVTLTVSGTGIAAATAEPLVAAQVVSLEDTRPDGTIYYNFYTVVSMTDSTLVLQLMDLTGATPSGVSIAADGKQFFTIDANEAGETRVVGALMNGPIWNIVPQGDYAYSFKERSIQSIQYTGLGNGTFFIHNEVSGEGLMARNAVVDRHDGTMVFLGHRELYAYQGGPNLIPVCMQATRQLFNELDRTRIQNIRLFHNENRKEVWVKYPVAGGFRVLIWNYIEDSASFDDYDSSLEFAALGAVDWDDQLPSRLPVLASPDGSLLVHGQCYNRAGLGYLAVSETMDYDLGEPDLWKYVDVVVLGLDVKVTDSTARYMTVQIGSQQSLSGGDITWTAAQQVLVNGNAPVPVKVNPGGSGRYLRVRFSSSDPDVQWRVSSFEVHCRPGSFY